MQKVYFANIWKTTPLAWVVHPPKKGKEKKKLITSVFYFATDGHSVGMDFHTPSHETHSWHL